MSQLGDRAKLAMAYGDAYQMGVSEPVHRDDAIVHGKRWRKERDDAVAIATDALSLAEHLIAFAPASERARYRKETDGIRSTINQLGRPAPSSQQTGETL